ncbi:MAG: helix-turn-helix transcriptional regulator [Actinomycetota bacterium]
MTESRRLLERDEPLAVLRAALTKAQRGQGSLHLIEGHAGVGKTALLDSVAQDALERGFMILEGRGKEREREVPLVVVEDLFRSHVLALEPGERKSLLRGSAGLAAPLFEQPFSAQQETSSVFEGLFWLTVNLAERRPLAILIDDGRWVDASSVRFIAYLAARIEDLPVVVVLGTRTYEPELLPSVIELRQHPICKRLLVQPLTRTATDQIVRAQFPEATDRFCEACFEATTGNPFYLRELLAGLEGVVTLGADHEAAEVHEQGPHTVARSVQRRLSLVDEGAVRLAQSVAVLDENAELALAAGLAGVDVDQATEWAASLAAAGILTPSEPLSFVHPIVRTATYKHIDPTERVKVHEEAVRVLHSAGAPPEKLAPHVLLAGEVEGVRTDDVLRAAAARALRRGAPQIAIDYLQRVLAGALSTDDRVDALVELGEAEAMSGSSRAVLRSAEAANLCSDPEQRARARLRIAKALIGAGRRREAAGVVVPGFEELDERHDSLRRELEATFVFAGLIEPSLQDAATKSIERVLLRTKERVLGAERAALAHSALYLTATGEGLERAVELASLAYGNGELFDDEPDDELTVTIVSGVLNLADRFTAAIEVCDRAIAEARARGSINGFANASVNRTYPLRHAGRIPDAIADAQQAIDARRFGWKLFLTSAHAQLAHALMDSGDLTGAGSVLMAIDDDDYKSAPEFGLFLEARGRWHVLSERREEARADLEQAASRLQGSRYLNQPTLSAWPQYLARASVGTEHEDRAAEVAVDFLERARRWGAPRGISLALRTVALVEKGDHGIELLREAMTQAERSEAMVERALVQVALGRALNDAGRKGEARDWLRRGIHQARQHGVFLLAAQALSLISDAGGRPRRLSLTGVEALTPSERRVAQMVASGLSNREVAEGLFVTVKAVEAHLGKVYRKLAISSRAQLGGALKGALGDPTLSGE